MTTPLDLVLTRLGPSKRSGRNYRVRCPGPNHANGDRNPSLDIAEGENGAVLFNCRSGQCSTESIVSASGLEMKDIFPTSNNPFSYLNDLKIGKRPSYVNGAATNGTSTTIVRTAAQIEKRLVEPVLGRRASDIDEEPITWLWQDMIPLGMLVLIDGVEGIGKTWIVLAIIASATRGRGFYGMEQDEHIPPCTCLLFAPEDSAAAVLIKRLNLMGADLSKVIIVDAAINLNTPAGLDAFDRAMNEYRPQLVVFDPIFSFVGGIDINQDNQVRLVTAALKGYAEEFNCAMILVRHIGKSKGMGNARNAGLGGVGWRASVRRSFIVGQNPENPAERAIASDKNNLTAEKPRSIGYKIMADGLQWTGESKLTVEQMLSMKSQETHEERSAKESGIEFLKTRLSNGRVETKTLFSEAKSQLGISESTLTRAKSAIGVKAVKPGFGTGWAWELPHSKPANPGLSACSKCGKSCPEVASGLCINCEESI